MKKRKSLALLLISIIVSGVMPSTVSAASTNRVSETVAVKEGTTLKAGEEPILHIEMKDVLTTAQSFYLELDGAEWLGVNEDDADNLVKRFPVGDAAQKVVAGEKVDKKFNFVSKNSDSEKSYVFEAYRENNKRLVIRLLDENIPEKDLSTVTGNEPGSNLITIDPKIHSDESFKFTFPMAVKVTGKEAAVMVEKFDSTISNTKHLFAVSDAEKASVKIDNANVPIFYTKGTISPISIEELYSGQLSSWSTKEDRTITIKLENPEFEFDAPGLENISLGRGFSGIEGTSI
ncbi:MAG TPA: hypothetical protein GX707_01870, partial [Epulopiscium sp.]|nr:hypothetical protein [Candidatus Epulonipiscium sp.]